MKTYFLRSGKLANMNFEQTVNDSIDILDVGHGNCSVIKSGEDVIIIDTGRGIELIEYLMQNGITIVKLVLLSHADADHIGGLIGLLGSAQITIENVYLNSDSQKGSDLWDDLLYELDCQNRDGKLNFQVQLTSDEEYHFSFGAVAIDILAPSKYLAGRGPGSTDREGRQITTNTISAVVEVKVEGEPIAVFPGDLDIAGLKNLMANNNAHETIVLVYPHHGSGTPEPDIEEFVNGIIDHFQPHNIAYSIGRGKFENPNPKVIAAIREKRGDIRNICTQLSKNCAKQIPVGIDKCLSSHMVARGRSSNSCCAGTISLPLNGSIELIPNLQNHSEFIQEWVPDAICTD